jgi:putative transposase
MSWQPTTLSKVQKEERRLEGGRLLLAGRMSQAEIARHLGVSQKTVALWKQQLRAHGNKLVGLRAREAYRKPPRLTPRQWTAVKRMILKGALAAGFPTERWTLPRIQQAIAEHWNVRYSTAWLSVRLRQLGLSVQRPVTVARAKDDELAEAWIRQDWPRIKKSVVEWRSHTLLR